MKYRSIALIFSGQGSQYPGMGKDIYDNFASARRVFEEASDVLGYDLKELCFSKPSEAGGKITQGRDINKTIYTQPAVFTTGYACFRAFLDTCRSEEIPFDFKLTAGHSLGEYTALVAAGVMDYGPCLSLVRERATRMTEVGRNFPDAGLLAVVDRRGDLDFEMVSALCEKHGLYITLKNTRRQLVIGGLNTGLTEIAQELKKLGTTTTVLKVEGPFHTPMMKPAADKLKKSLDRADFKKAVRPIIANGSADIVVEPHQIKDELYRQIFRLVDWRGSIEKAASCGTDLFIEFGPKKVLSNMLKDICADIPRLNVEDMASLEATVKALRE